MACGTPVVTSTASSLPEVAGDAAPMVDPYDIEAAACALKKFIDDSDYRQQCITAGYDQVKKFSWEKSAQALLRIYCKVLDQ